ncbi:MAG: TonB-dependent receptor [Cyclobacteriaceae bacterium]
MEKLNVMLIGLVRNELQLSLRNLIISGMLLSLICSLETIAQNERKISGQVLDANTEPLVGATLLEKGTNNGTVSDLDGNFEFIISSENAILIVSYIGYETQEVATVGRTNLAIVLAEQSSELLNEVVVVGYGTQRRKDLTGSIASVSSEAIENQPLASIDQLLQGRAAGVNISQSSGAPGGRSTIRIRGASSVNAGNEPLLVIDGIPMYNGSKDPGGTSYGTSSPTNPLASLNPNDIASIEILKDASSTAIYGSRGSNGVIIITTKRGESGAAKVNYNGYYGVQNVVDKLDLMNGQEHAEFLNDWAMASGLEAPFSNPASIGEGTDWQNEIFRSSAIQDHQLSLSGGNENTKYFISANYFNQEGVIINSGMERYSIRLNVDQKINEKIQFNQSLTFNRTINNSLPISNAGSDNVRSAGERAYVTSPTIPVRDDEGNYVDVWYGVNKPESPVASLLTTKSTLTGDNLLGNLSLDYEIAEGLVFQTMAGVNLMNRSNEEFYPGGSTYIGGLFGGLGMISNRRITNILNENTLRFSRNFLDHHSLEVLAGFTWQKETTFLSSLQPTGFPNDLLGINSVGGTTGTPIVGSNLLDWSIASFLGRVNYQFDDKWLLTATVRADGSSRFAMDNKWGYFPSVAMGYRLSEEGFMEDFVFLDDLKIRGSYGLTGNQEIGNYQSLARLVTNLIYIFDNQLVSGARQSSLSNQNLSWERSAQWDIGLDMSFFEDRIRVIFDYYKKDTRDLLFTINLPSYSGFSSALFNTGMVENRGIELDLGIDVIRGNDFSWNMQTNYSRNKTAMTDLGQSASTNLFIGHPPGVGLGYLFDGVFRDQAEVQDHGAQPNAMPGDMRYVDSNEDGIFNADDRVLVGNPVPDYIFGSNHQFNYKGLSLSVFFQGVIGHDGNRISRLFDPSDVSSNKARALVERWTPENPDSNIPRAGVSNWLGSSFLRQDLSFVKLRNIQLGYQIPVQSLSGISDARVYVSGQNLITFTNDYFGYDPDGGGGGYPTARTIVFGLNLGF